MFIVEKDERLQEKMREKFKELGYRVLISLDPMRALDRFRQQPFDALIIDAGTVGDEGRMVFQQILVEAASKRTPVAAIILFSKEQKNEALRVEESATTKAFVAPVTLKQLYTALEQMVKAKK